MNLNAELIKAIKAAIPNSFVGVVKAVDESEFTIDVDPVSGTSTVFSVRIKSVVDADDVAIVFIPVVGSTVVCSPIEHNSNVHFVSSFSQVERIKIKNSSGGNISIESDGTVFLNGESFSGIVKADELKLQLDKTNELVNAIAESLLAFTPIAGDGGAALKVFASTTLSGKVVGDFSNIKNNDVKHGSI